jgi:2-methylcitrate dehydratase PrpD
MYCRNYDANHVAKDLGKMFYSDCVIKPYSSCRMTHPFIDCALNLVKKTDIDVDGVARVTVHSTQNAADSFCGQSFSHVDLHQPDGAFSIRYCVAAALIWREVGPRQFTEEFLRDRRVGDLISRMSLVPDISPASADGGLAEIEVLMDDGRTLSARARGARGDVREGQVDFGAVKTKFLANADFGGLDGSNALRVADMIERLEDLEDVKDLPQLLVKGA